MFHKTLMGTFSGAYILYKVASPYQCSGNTLTSAVREGDVVLCDQWMHLYFGLKKGDVVAASPNANNTDDVDRFPFYRVLALEGEDIERIKVPAGKILLEGETKNNTTTLLMLPYSSVRGKAYLRVLPNLKPLLRKSNE